MWAMLDMEVMLERVQCTNKFMHHRQFLRKSFRHLSKANVSSNHSRVFCSAAAVIG